MVKRRRKHSPAVEPVEPAEPAAERQTTDRLARSRASHDEQALARALKLVAALRNRQDTLQPVAAPEPSKA
ncbi:MAG: hypothetical protein JNL87_23020 [Burkholderiaceae bacterium]|nr:hypothetical protein [Burkholderiaceae bacterium]